MNKSQTLVNWLKMVASFIQSKETKKLVQFIDLFKNRPNKELLSKELSVSFLLIKKGKKNGRI